MLTARRTISGAAGDTLNVVIANCWFDRGIPDPELLLERYHALTGWAEAVARAGAASVTVVQRFTRNAFFRHGSVDYRFVADGGPGSITPWFLGARFAKAISDLRPHVVHVGGLIFPAIVGCLRAGLPRETAIVVQDHGGVRAPPRGLRSPGRRLLYGLGLGCADAFMFTAREQATLWQDTGIIGTRHTVYEVLESSTDMASWQSSTGAEAVLPGKPAILWVGRLDANKDPVTVLDGFAAAAVSLPQAAITLVYGDDLLLPTVEAWIAAHPAVRTRIQLCGRVDRKALPAFYSSADLFVIGSHREVACFSLIEAMSFGVTPVVTDIPPFRVITSGGRIGALFPPGDSRALKRAIERLSGDNHQARRRLVQAHFEHELSWPAVGARALDVYRSAVSSRRAGLATS